MPRRHSTGDAAAERQRRDREHRDREILAVLAALGSGEVTTYGDVAATAGHPGLSRHVGTLLATTDLDVPWWRVVNAAGRLVPGAEREQAARLRAEGVRVEAGRVVAAPVGRFSRRRAQPGRSPA